MTGPRHRRSGVALTLPILLTITCGGGADSGPTPERPPPIVNPELDEATGLALAALPLACLDRPHGAPRRGAYLYERTHALLDDHESTRAFYGCFDWHSAVNGTWALVELLSRFPASRVAPLIAEKLDQHLSPEALAGELAFFVAPDNRTFERPYGWAWFLELHAALLRASHPRATDWSNATAPLAEVFVEGLVSYLAELDYPMRVGTHANTAFALDLALDYAVAADHALAELIGETAVRLFAGDVDCPLAFEPSASDFLSPCLQEATLMARLLEPDAFLAWHDDFMPPVESRAFASVASAIRLGSDAADLDVGLLGAKSHLIGLAFTRAEGLRRVAAALPPDDARGAAYRRAAASQAERGLAAMFDADYLGSHWLGTFALRYLLTLDEPG